MDEFSCLGLQVLEDHYVEQQDINVAVQCTAGICHHISLSHKYKVGTTRDRPYDTLTIERVRVNHANPDCFMHRWTSVSLGVSCDTHVVQSHGNVFIQ